ncbi:hypothetical protein VNTUMSATTG_59720 (plasmid) [Vibrio nigripulchritudo]|nr:hypothetical protein VNTUMSATTG_59720 [Vibrio nigripulchritudo]
MLGTLGVAIALFLLFLVFETLSYASMKSKKRAWESIAEAHLMVLLSLEEYYRYDCSDDGSVTVPDLNKLKSEGFLNAGLLNSPYNFDFNLRIKRPNYSFNPEGRVVADGVTFFTLEVGLSPAHLHTHYITALKTKGASFTLSGGANPKFRITRSLTLSESEAKQEYLDGGIGFLCV